MPHLQRDAATPAPPAAPRASAWGRALASAAQAPGVVREGLGLLVRSTVLRGLVVAGAFNSVVMVVQESLVPIRLAELVGSRETAGALMGPAAAAGWAAFSVGAAGYGRLARRVGVARTAMVARVLHCLGALMIGLAAGPAVLLALYLLTYGLFGGGAMHHALLHREASARNRATVMSIDSMGSFLAFAVASPLLGLLAARTSTPVAVVVAALVGLIALVCYVPALRAERTRAHAPA